MDYNDKYLKYKIKYIHLKKVLEGGNNEDFIIKNLNGLFNEFDKYLNSTKTEINCINTDYSTISNNKEFNESLKEYSNELTELINNYNPSGLNYKSKYDKYSIILDKLFNMYRKINNTYLSEIKNNELIQLKRMSREDTCNKQISINSFHNFANQNLVRFHMLLSEINKTLNKTTNTIYIEIKNKVNEDLCKYKNTITNINNSIKIYDEEKNNILLENMMYELVCLHQDYSILSNDNNFKRDFDLFIKYRLNEYGKIIIKLNYSKKLEEIILFLENILNDIASIYLEFKDLIEDKLFINKFDLLLKDTLFEYNTITDKIDINKQLEFMKIFLEKILNDFECLYSNHIKNINNKEFDDKINIILQKLYTENEKNNINNISTDKNIFMQIFLDNLKSFVSKYKNKIKKHSKSNIIRTNKKCSIPIDKNLFNYFIDNFLIPTNTNSTLLQKIREIKNYVNN